MYKTIRNFISSNRVVCKETFLFTYPAPLKLKELNEGKKISKASQRNKIRKPRWRRNRIPEIGSYSMPGHFCPKVTCWSGIQALKSESGGLLGQKVEFRVCQDFWVGVKVNQFLLWIWTSKFNNIIVKVTKKEK